MIATKHGLSIVALTSETDEERVWLTENVSTDGWQWLDNTLHVDTRMAADILEAALDAGFQLVLS